MLAAVEGLAFHRRRLRFLKQPRLEPAAMGSGLSNILVAALALLLLAAALWDIRSRIIPNWLNVAIALGAIPFWWASGLALWPDIALQVAVAAALFGVFAIAFALGAMGGGDVKMVAAER
jgi:prepilin peptidase CpaA